MLTYISRIRAGLGSQDESGDCVLKRYVLRWGVIPSNPKANDCTAGLLPNGGILRRFA